MIRTICVGLAALLSVGVAGRPQAAAQMPVRPDSVQRIAFAAVEEGLSSADRAKVEARVAELNRLASAGDMFGAFDVVPPRIIRTLSERAGVSEGEFRAAMRELVNTQMQGVNLVSFKVDLAAASTARTPNGARTYLLIPTSTVVQVGGGRVRVNTSTLALEDEGEWYLIRVDDANQVALIRELWPEFAPVEFPTGTMEPVS